MGLERSGVGQGDPFAFDVEKEKFIRQQEMRLMEWNWRMTDALLRLEWENFQRRLRLEQARLNEDK